MKTKINNKNIKLILVNDALELLTIFNNIRYEKNSIYFNVNMILYTL